MELLIITAVQSFEGEVKQILRNSKVKVYSQMEVAGFKDLSGQPDSENWFGADGGEHRSVLFYAFIATEHVDDVLEKIAALNKTQETHSYVHAAVLEIKKSV